MVVDNIIIVESSESGDSNIGPIMGSIVGAVVVAVIITGIIIAVIKGLLYQPKLYCTA